MDIAMAFWSWNKNPAEVDSPTGYLRLILPLVGVLWFFLLSVLAVVISDGFSFEM
jgi:hypothetical protein